MTPTDEPTLCVDCHTAIATTRMTDGQDRCTACMDRALITLIYYLSPNRRILPRPFRTLSPVEVGEFEQYARDNDPPQLDHWFFYHPVFRAVWLARGITPPRGET